MPQSLIEINTQNVLDISRKIEDLSIKFRTSINQYATKSKELYQTELSENTRQFNLGLTYIKSQVKISEADISEQRSLIERSYQIQKQIAEESAQRQPEMVEEEEEPSLIETVATAAIIPTVMIGMYDSGLEIGPPNDPDGQQTGLDMSLPGGIGAPIYAPMDMFYRTKGTDGMPSVGLQGTADVRGPAGRGFGYYGAYYYTENGKTYEVLMGHLAAMGYRGSRENEPIPKGTLLGYQGASGRTVGSGGQPYPHISLHINGVGFVANNGDLLKFAGMLAGQSATTAQPQQRPKRTVTTPTGSTNPPTVIVTPPPKPTGRQTNVVNNQQVSMLNSGRSGLPLEQILFATV